MLILNFFSLVKWSVVCSPKKFGGMSVLNLKYMNLALLSKWWWRYQLDIVSFWKSVLKVKYSCLFIGCLSPFWSSISKMVSYMCINMKFLVGSSTNILFWFDIWYGEVPFYIQFSNLFAKTKSPLSLTMAQI
jgi:hypothetical protein